MRVQFFCLAKSTVEVKPAHTVSFGTTITARSVRSTCRWTAQRSGVNREIADRLRAVIAERDEQASPATDNASAGATRPAEC